MILNNSKKVFSVLSNLLNEYQEELYIITLGSDLKMIELNLIFKGTVNYCPIHARDIFRIAIKQNAHSIIMAHNHPSGNSQPTSSDQRLTKRIIRCGNLLEIPVLDHIVFAQNEYYSFNEGKKTIVRQSARLIRD